MVLEFEVAGLGRPVVAELLTVVVTGAAVVV